MLPFVVLAGGLRHALVDRLLLVVALAVVCFGLSSGTCRADFVVFTPPPGDANELKLFNSVAVKDVMSFTGSVGMQKGGFPVLIQAGSAMDVTIDSGAGFATIKPDHGLLTTLTFTPQDIPGFKGNTIFNDFATNGQLVGPKGNADEMFSLSVVALEPDGSTKTIPFGPFTIKADSNGAFPFDFAVMGINGETIQSVTFSADNGIKESKQTEFSLAPNGPPPLVGAVPAPPSAILLGMGAVAVLFGLSRRGRVAAA